MTRQIPGWLVGLALFVVGAIAISVVGTASNRHPLVGKPAAEIGGPTADGGAFSLADQKGKVVLVNFWGTWCGPCRMEIPDLIALQETYGGRGFTVVGPALDDDPGAPDDQDLMRVNAFAKANGINYPLLLNKREWQDAYGGVPAVPTSFLVDKNGRIAQVWVGLVSKDQLIPEIERRL
ncbi:MAG TPA: redoxin domain-containing protein [Armatimonadaceae bacterium]|jgi:cytochrome c biogenesis protein CcmG/thiol:disulfide interchange protein DsbE|nr:redoxin domain-containing protein [Armatimonadaceae bacterium]